MSTRIFRMAVVVSVAVLQGVSFGELWSRTSPNVRLTTSSDNVGIGTSTIGSKLQVNGNSAIGYSASTAAPSNGLAVSGNTGIGTTTIGSKLQVNGNSAIGYSASTAAPSNGLAVSGNTGIGTTTIGSKLQVNGNAAIGYSASTAGPTNGLAVSGNVGIGITNPGFGIDVEKLLGNTSAKFGNSLPVYMVSSHPCIGFNTYFNGGWKFGKGSSNSYCGIITLDPTTGNFNFYTSNAGNTDGAVTATTKFTISRNGHVGIGSTNPMYNTLEVVGDAGSMNALSVSNWNGMTAITAQSNGTGATMNVSNQNGTNGIAASFYGNVQISSGSLKVNNWTIEAPDYVFEKDYKLPSLKSVEKHIAAEKHLPGVPSAADMKKNGVDLSEMNMTLLKKVEELTLYVIEQNRKIEALEKKVAAK